MGQPGDIQLMKAIQAATDLRLVLPFGLSLQLGDVVSVGEDGRYTLEGSTRSQLGMDPGKQHEASAPEDFWKLFDDDSTCTYRPAGTASAPFPDLPSESSGFDVHFESDRGWLLAAAGWQVRTLDTLNRFRRPILDACQRKVWDPAWALVTEVATAKRVTLVAATAGRTDVALSLDGKDNPAAGVAAQLTAGLSVTQASQPVTTWIRSESAVVACRAVRVRDRWWGGGQHETPTDEDGAGEVDDATDEEFWEDADDLLPDRTS